MRLLVVEDDPMIGAGLCKGLQQEGYAVDWVRDAAGARVAIATEPYRLVLLDLGLPGGDGLAVLREARARGASVPIVILTARDGVAERVRGLDLGADDYVVKPFDLDELAARIRAVLRRHAGQADSTLAHGDLALDLATHEVRWRGAPVAVSPREFALLAALIERPGAVLSRAQLEERVYGWGEEVASNAIEVHVHHLRRKLSEDVIRTVRGAGYALGAA